jgi:hypothetical protein
MDYLNLFVNFEYSSHPFLLQFNQHDNSLIFADDSSKNILLSESLKYGLELRNPPFAYSISNECNY